jgi:CDP-glycerol glycerophosphotransferase
MASPVLSVVLVVHGRQAYVRDCVRSILDQPFAGVEVLAVDNASPDHASEILDELAQEDPRVRVRHLERRLDLGEARNLALEDARGEYVWFVGTTDRAPSGALAAVAGRLEASPDVLVVGHARARPLRPPEPGPQQEVLRAAPREPFAVADYPAIARLGLEVRDKVFRRAFLDGEGLRFASGRDGHLPFVIPALLAAGRIRVLPLVAYERFEPLDAGRGADDGTPDDVFAQADAVFRFADARGGVAEAVRRLVAWELLRSQLSLLGGLSGPERRAFFDRMAESSRRHLRGAEPPSASRSLRLAARLVARGRYRTLLALGWALARHRTLRRGLGRARRAAALTGGAVRRQALRLYYWAQRLAPIDPDLAVFAAYWYRGYACNPRAVYERLGALVPRARGVWVVAEKHAAGMPPDVEHVVAGTRAYYRLLARARYFVNNVNFPDEVVKRPGTIHVQTHHGTPLKTMGLDLRDAFVAGGRMDFEGLLRRAGRWDYSVSSNRLSTLVWERAYPVPCTTLEVGYPRNDMLANATDADVARVRQELGIAPGRRAVLLAPTHREYLRRYVPTVDVERLAEALGPDHVILVRTHYFYADDPAPAHGPRTSSILDVTRHPSVEELCLAADVLLTDYSSIMFDYAVLDRPIVVHAPDWDVYRTLRGTTFDLLAAPPGVVTTTHEELVAAFRSGAVSSEHAARLRAAFRARFCALDDGAASDRVIRAVWLGAAGGEEPAPAPVEPPRAGVGA